ncbi:MAG: TetR/AcrR family transcriptional regulator [Chloroflexota bacterium]
MARPLRNAQQVDLQAAIKETAWQQIAESGASSLSLRSIARALGITAPAIYNYFPRRDDLVTAMIIDAYTSFGDVLIAARDAILTDDRPGRLIAIGIAYRQWALDYPQRYHLIFGTPIPGYVAPMEKVQPFAARALGVLVSVVETLRQAGELNSHGFPKMGAEFEPDFENWKNHVGKVNALSRSVAVLIWCQVHGLVSLEIAGSLQPFGVNGDSLYFYQLNQINKQFIIQK